MGALAAIYQIWQDSAVSSSAPVPTWLLAIGGVGIMLGVLLWGYKVGAGAGAGTGAAGRQAAAPGLWVQAAAHGTCVCKPNRLRL